MKFTFRIKLGWTVKMNASIEQQNGIYFLQELEKNKIKIGQGSNEKLTLCFMSHNEIYETLKLNKNIFHFLVHFLNQTCLNSENECIN